MSTRIQLRMYNVGFGDCFLLTLVQPDATWRMLIDCGSHSQGQAHPIEEVVADVVTHLTAESDDGVPRLDVVVATHRHADHVKGFESDIWCQVEVGEVWLPYVEDPSDQDAQSLRSGIEAAAAALSQTTRPRLAAGQGSRKIAVANDLASLALSNDNAMGRLLSQGGRSFRNRPPVKYWPRPQSDDNHFRPSAAGGNNELDNVTVHMLGPSRDPEFLRRMHPPKSAEWLHIGAWRDQPSTTVPALFAGSYKVPWNRVPKDLQEEKKRARLTNLGDDDTLLGAAVRLDRVVNNTSLFMVLEVGELTIVLPGDAQQGSWDYVRSTELGRALLSHCDIYKIGHHGSHNATPRAFLEQDWIQDRGYAMLPWGRVPRWPEIPKQTLLDQLAVGRRIIRIDNPIASPEITYEGDKWCELIVQT